MEHSLGVMHLAGEFLQHLMLKRPGCASKVGSSPLAPPPRPTGCA
jgi:HD superfamily phosphohydrolase